ncbi:hypothetical protein BGZ94_008736 [Podila epigama]|nr:hypothetical protein BGZ94_008736 [Podila epigama]
MAATDTPVTAAAAYATMVDPDDTTHILEQGFILLVSGRIVLGTPSSSLSSSSSSALLASMSSPWSYSATADAATAGTDSTTFFSNNDHQESSLAFFDGQSWFPYLQSSRNAFLRPGHAPMVGTGTPVEVPSTLLPELGQDILNLAAVNVNAAAAAAAASTGNPNTANVLLANVRIRDQGVLRALAIAHLPRIISREYMALPYVILISMAISLGLIVLIVLTGFLYAWLKRRFSKEPEVPRPRLGSSFMDEDLGYGHGYYDSLARSPSGIGGYSSTVGTASGSMIGGGLGGSKGDKAGGGNGGGGGGAGVAGRSSLFKKRSSSKQSGLMHAGMEKDPGSSSALMNSLGITNALESSRQMQNQKAAAAAAAVAAASATSLHNNKPHGGLTVNTSTTALSGRRKSGRGQSHRQGKHEEGGITPSSSHPIVYRPNSTIAEATDALVTEFVKQHRSSMVSSLNGGGHGSANSGSRPHSATASSSALVNTLTHSHALPTTPKETKPDGAPPSPDRSIKQARFSKQRMSGLDNMRNSSGSDLTSPTTQGQFATMLAAATRAVGGNNSNEGSNRQSCHPKRPSTPVANDTLASPVTTMTTPSGNMYPSSPTFDHAIIPVPVPGMSTATVDKNQESTSSDTNNNNNNNQQPQTPHQHQNPYAIAHGGVIYYAKFPFRAREIGELGFKTGDRILVVDQSDDIWWMGVIQDSTGQQLHGVFPSNYVGPTP